MTCDDISNRLSTELTNFKRTTYDSFYESDSTTISESLTRNLFPPPLKFVGRVSEGRQMVDAFLPLYYALVEPRLGHQNYYSKMYPVVVCAAASGVGKSTCARRTFDPTNLDRLYPNPEHYKLAYLTSLKASSSLHLRVVLRPTMRPAGFDKLEHSVALRILT